MATPQNDKPAVDVKAAVKAWDEYWLPMHGPMRLHGTKEEAMEVAIKAALAAPDKPC